MNKIYLSKSKYCKCVQCEKILWLDKYKRGCATVDEDNSSLETGRQVGEFAKGLFGDYVDVPHNENESLMIEKTEELLKDKPNIITEATLSYDNNSCRVDILKNDSDGVEIYEVKSSTKVKDIHMDDVAYQYFVLSNLGLNVKKACLVYINNKYIRGTELDIKQLFHIDDITDIVKQKQDDIRNNIDFINGFMEKHNGDNEPVKELGLYCLDPYQCAFWEYCTKDLPKLNVFDIVGMRKSTKFKKYSEGKISFEDLKHDDINQKYLEQIDFELNDLEPKIEKEDIKKFLSQLKYPLYFIDYEACQYAIPEYEGTYAYQQIPFQYSLHIIREEGAPTEHKEFLAEVDDENIVRTFAESMISALPEDGSVIVYYMPFEKSHVNKKIAEMYPDLKPEIDRINGNMVDFEVPFKKRHYYVKEMEGFSSIKKVLPALYPDDEKLNYNNQPLVHNGIEASQAFLRLKDETPEQQEKTREGLLEYCKLDTYAMVKIWEKFKEVTEGD